MSIFLFSKDILRCPICGGTYDRRRGIRICLKCGEDLIPESEYEGQPLYGSNSSKVTCPYCNSMNTSKIGTVNRMLSTSMFGLASSKIGKTHKCNDCGSTW